MDSGDLLVSKFAKDNDHYRFLHTTVSKKTGVATAKPVKVPHDTKPSVLVERFQDILYHMILCYQKQHRTKRFIDALPELVRVYNDHRHVAARGEGFFGDLISRLFPTRNNFPPKVRDVIKEYGGKTITRVIVGRTPVQGYVTRALNWISQGKLMAQQKKLNYDDLYHLFTLVTLDSGETLLVEKNSVINMEKVSPDYPAQAKMHVDLNNKRVLFGDWINSTVQRVGPKIYLYDAVNNNCQVFVLELLETAGWLTPNLRSFIFQDIQSVLSTSPAFTTALAKFFTETHAKTDRVLHGADLESLGISTDSGGQGLRGPQGIGIQNISSQDNNDGTVSLTVTLTDTTTQGPFTFSTVSDDLICDQILVSGTDKTNKFVVQDAATNNTFVVDTSGNQVVLNNTSLQFNGGSGSAVTVTNSGGMTVGQSTSTAPLIFNLTNSNTAATASSSLKFTSGTGTGSQNASLTYSYPNGFTFSDKLSSIKTYLTASSIVQTDASSNLTVSNTLSSINLSSATLTSALGVSSNNTYDLGDASHGIRNSYNNQIILLPNDSAVGVIKSHVTGTAIEEAVSISSGGGDGFLIDINGNAQIIGDTFYKASGISFSNPSDRRLKENIKDFNKGLDVVSQVRVRSFNFKKDKNKKPLVGIVAQELQAVYSKAIFTGKDGYLHFDSNDLTFLLINAVQDLKQIVDQQQQQIQELQAEIQRIDGQ